MDLPKGLPWSGAHGVSCIDEDNHLLGAGGPCPAPSPRGREKAHWDPSEQGAWRSPVSVCLFLDAAATDSSSASPVAGYPVHDNLAYLLLSAVERSFPIAGVL